MAEDSQKGYKLGAFHLNRKWVRIRQMFWAIRESRIPPKGGKDTNNNHGFDCVICRIKGYVSGWWTDEL